MLSTGAKKRQAEYMKKWRAEHKDKVKAYREKYWERKAQREADEVVNPADRENEPQ